MGIRYSSLFSKDRITPVSTVEFFRECLMMPGDFLYRGQGDYRWALIPSAFRAVGGGLLTLAERARRVSYYSSTRFDSDFGRLTAAGLERERFELSEQDGYARLTKMMLFQHFGIPTPLLDWTESPLVALFMATAFKPSSSKRVRIYRMDPSALPDTIKVQRYSDIGFERIRRQLGGVTFVGKIESSGKVISISDRVIQEYLEPERHLHEAVCYLDVKVNKADTERIFFALRSNGFSVDNLFPNSPHWAAQAISADLPWL